ncbi:MAG: DUF4290 domain-containing protein, partial [Bacteroidetes bacterium]|nr:DUF4290 domain-containing protein [Bacteroidota bacterium]
MEFEYNSQLEDIAIREYGRNVQRMVNHLATINDRAERNIAAQQVIKVMNQVNPDTTKASDYEHKLWDHLHIMSGYQLDVDSPYQKPSPEELLKRPDLPMYNTHRFTFRHYGTIIDQMIGTACEEESNQTRQKMAHYIAAYMKMAYKTWNDEKVADEVIIQNLREMSGGKLVVETIAEISENVSAFKSKSNQNNNRN